MLEALLKGVSTRDYAAVILGMADSVGLSRSAISREAAAAGEQLLERLPKRDKMLVRQTRSLLRTAWRTPDAEEGMVRMRKLDQMLKHEHPQVAASLREGLEETFTINRADVPLSFRGCLATTAIIESPQAGVRKKATNVSRWRDPATVEGWAVGAVLLTGTHFRRTIGDQNLCESPREGRRLQQGRERGAMSKEKARRYSPEVRERAVRLELEHSAEHPSQWAAECGFGR